MSNEEDQKQHINRIISAIRDEDADSDPGWYGDATEEDPAPFDESAASSEEGHPPVDREYYADEEERRQWDYAESQAVTPEPEQRRNEHRTTASSKAQPTSGGGITSWLMDWRLIAALAILLAGLYMVNFSGERDLAGGEVVALDNGQLQQLAALEQRIAVLERRLDSATADGEPLSVAPSGDFVSQDELQILRDQVNAGLQAQENTARSELKELEQRLSKAIDSQVAAAPQPAPAATTATQTQTPAPSRPAVEATTSGSWFVNVATYSQEGTAASLVESLQQSGRSAAIIPTTLGGEPSYRVRVVSLPSRDAAQSAARELEAQLGLRGLWVGQD